MKTIIHGLLKENITPILHLDNDWTLNLPYFLDLPKKKIVLELDGFTNIFHAKKVLGGHTCLLGDVPSTLFVAGTPEEVKEYCGRLLSEVGDGGGFIYSSGCSLPYQARHENVEAFFNSISDFSR